MCVCVLVGQRKRERVSECVCVSQCVWVCVGVCVCLCVSGTEKKRELVCVCESV